MEGGRIATVIDRHNQEVIGHAMAEHMRAGLACDPVELAWRRGPDPPRHEYRTPYEARINYRQANRPRGHETRCPVQGEPTRCPVSRETQS
jgi:hypothetical protein